jgi:hypothetical protein
MELKNPLFLMVGIPVVIAAVVVFHLIKMKMQYSGGVKAANTRFVKELPEYKKLKRFRNILGYATEAALIVSMIASLTLLARPYKTETTGSGVKKRDIFLCMDVSYSIYNLNAELVDRLQKVVSGMKGDRFGIAIYNTSTVLYVPMTDDYDFVVKKLEDIKEYFSLQKRYMDKFGKYHYTSEIPDEDMDEYKQLRTELDYYDAGTLVDNMTKGSSLIGEGLASCMYDFPRLEKQNRTRVIIMSTDNAQEERSKPLVELQEAAELCKKHDITVFGIFPNKSQFDQDMSMDYETDKEDMRECVELTGGSFYEESDSLSVDDIITDIQRKEAMEVDEITTTREVDQPKVPLTVLMIGLLTAFGCGMMLMRGWKLK